MCICYFNMTEEKQLITLIEKPFVLSLAIQCPTGMVYHECGSYCPPTCDDIDAVKTCQGGCIAGCFCPDGQVLLNGTCVDLFVCTG